MTPATGEELTSAFLGRGSVGVVFLAFGLGAIAFGILPRQASWFLAAVAIPGAAAALVGTTSGRPKTSPFGGC
jgi:dolichol kinase